MHKRRRRRCLLLASIVVTIYASVGGYSVFLAYLSPEGTFRWKCATCNSQLGWSVSRSRMVVTFDQVFVCHQHHWVLVYPTLWNPASWLVAVLFSAPPAPQETLCDPMLMSVEGLYRDALVSAFLFECDAVSELSWETLNYELRTTRDDQLAARIRWCLADIEHRASTAGCGDEALSRLARLRRLLDAYTPAQ